MIEKTDLPDDLIRGVSGAVEFESSSNFVSFYSVIKRLYVRMKFILLPFYQLKHGPRVNIRCYVNLVVVKTEIY